MLTTVTENCPKAVSDLEGEHGPPVRSSHRDDLDVTTLIGRLGVVDGDAVHSPDRVAAVRVGPTGTEVSP